MPHRQQIQVRIGAHTARLKYVDSGSRIREGRSDLI
jgi:hypothetical protein